MTPMNTATRMMTSCRTSAMTHLGMLLGLLTTVGASGCLDRPIGESQPQTHNVFLNRTKFSKVDKIDVLFMVDNSMSMADKQQVLTAAVPQLLRRLTSPDCIDPKNPAAKPVTMTDPTATCTTPGYEREFSPVKDIHIGVITSSLGDFGGNTCDVPMVTVNGKEVHDPSINDYRQAPDDRAWLLGSLERTKGALSPFLT